ncbi:MAG: hypothetical protein J2P56_05800 [Verrucomicrobia bacterium]|nr:hypothetical protein [Verrucomicrobiota bacterium]
MIQVWILAKNQNPVRAAKTGHNAVVCGNCPIKDACYVDLGKAPLQVWKAYKRGCYPVLPSLDVFKGRQVRFGAYGDPAFLPFELLRSIAEISAGWTGYTHQWRNPLFSAFKRYLMASVESTDGEAQARFCGWRTFRISRSLDPKPNEVVCPNTSRGITCADCGLCRGLSRPAKSIVIEVHGMRKKKLKAA